MDTCHSRSAETLTGLQLGPEILTVIDIKKAHISIEDGEELWTNIDGDKGPAFPIDLEILPERLPVFIPHEDDAEETSLFPHIWENVPPKLKLPWSEENKIEKLDYSKSF